MNNAAVWLLDHGVQPFPLKDRAKEPACKWQQYTCSREQAAQLANFGVRLTIGFGCVDTDSPEAEAWVAEHLPDTPFKVYTGRGVHRYYRLLTTPARFIHRNGHTIEFRSEGQYVVGPGSIHPSGSVYTSAEWSWNITDIPIFPKDFVFDDRTPEQGGTKQHRGSDDEGYEFPLEVSSGERHHELFKLLRSYKALGGDRFSAREAVRLANEYRCKPPLPENRDFEVWFRRGWDHVDRPLEVPSPTDLGMEF